MTQVKFVRTIHEDGRFRPFATEAYEFWREQGWIVGDILRPEQGMSFAEIVDACQEYLLDHPESELSLPVSETHIAWCLVKLLEYGMVRISSPAVRE